MWRECSLGDVITLKRGYDLPAQARIEGVYPIVSSAGVSGTHAEYKVRGPGVVTGRYGTLGEVHYIPGDFWPLNTTLYVQDFKGSHPRFVSYLLRTLDFGSRSGAAAVPGVNRNDLHRLPVKCPDVREQHRIASILSAYDDLIENNTRRIAILEEMARRIFEEWFFHFRFPGHEKVRMMESELGLVPEGWEVRPLGDIAAINSKSIRAGNAPREILYIDIASVIPGVIEQKQLYCFNDAPGRARRVVAHGDVLWSCVRPNRKSYALVLNPEPTLIASTGFAVLSPVAVPFSWLYYSVTADGFVSYLTNHATGAAYPAVTAAVFESAPMLLPSPGALQNFHSIVEPMLLLCESLKRKNANLRSTRELLLPKLISGELDVLNLPEQEVMAA